MESETSARHHTEATAWRTDTVMLVVRDSIFVSEKPDTVKVERWRTEYRERVHTDTVVVVERHADTVVKTATLQVEKTNGEGKPTGWAMAAFLGLLVVASCFIIKRKTK